MNPSDVEIAFLANSENRVALLQCLTDGPHARDGLTTKVGVSRVTLGRIVQELDDRSWITQKGQVCTITPLGAWVLEEYLGFSETMRAERRLREVFRWFPEEEYGFHIGALADAEITAVSRANASAPLSRHVRQFDAGGRFWSFSFAITRLFLDSCWRHVTDERITFDWVFTTEVLDVLENDPELSRQSREMLNSGRVEYRHFDGGIPYIVLGSEESVNLRLADEEGSPTALIESDADAVREWAESAFDRYWADATPVGIDAFTD
jgi:predicted transcriptional regulator